MHRQNRHCPTNRDRLNPDVTATIRMLRYTLRVLLSCSMTVPACVGRRSPSIYFDSLMPLTPAVIPREPLHTRTISVHSYARADGLWDLEAELIDYKHYDFPTREGGVFEAGRHVHHMHLRVTIDETFDILAAEAAYDAAPYGVSCTCIAPDYSDLAGMNLVNGFRHAVRARFARTNGCTHLTELCSVLPTAAVQTMANQRRLEADQTNRPFQLDGCHALRTDGDVALKYYPKWYTGSARSHADGVSSVAAPADGPSASHEKNDSSTNSPKEGASAGSSCR